MIVCHITHDLQTHAPWVAKNLQGALKNMNVTVLDNGVPRKAEDVLFADKVMETKANKGVWPTVELLLQYWLSKAPEEVKAFKVQVEDTRINLGDKKHGQTKDKNMERRLTIVFPEFLHQIIRATYSSNELKMDKEFFNEFASRFPAFRIPERL